ncbi:hypothetical protein A2Z23_03415 [Candidatus Curtissbacteria bacterium RBG_16_39_7]|uniref:Uncharacterized protein n=1 Tax=Candidatus Curtissbacteria bacterium RBG_16_39_7 TaxID=1797707 RepID=A0A1F5G2N9_9BACT|nr:MAG: hypothetical protein A2Z23_03415 [Candidatus Curtissbacteria bacterium RBG_16_39_7]
MEKTVRNYRIIIKPDSYPDTKKGCYTALCPTLGLADYGNTIDEALKNISALIKFHLECLVDEGKEIPTDNPEKELITTTQVSLSHA